MTGDFWVPDGPRIEDFGINFRDRTLPQDSGRDERLSAAAAAGAAGDHEHQRPYRLGEEHSAPLQRTLVGGIGISLRPERTALAGLVRSIGYAVRTF